ncbi:SPOR domain-containing protein [Kordiimonas aestuarii]|uniref:SPOR domain-containing protein n=1 Tax=Kordiimonas aestuarii TaxID=1005925 RepID=UPI0021D14639|nr:SPOR domain-containing protein [Kordiimonas aestuarii]
MIDVFHKTVMLPLLAALMAVPVAAQQEDEEEIPERTPTVFSGPTMADSEIEDALALVREGNVEAGAETLRRLGELGNPDAFFHLAEINRLGAGKESSEDVALMYYRFAARLGHRRAALSLANILFFEGQDTEAEYKEAMEIWQKYALRGEPEAMYLLGMVYWNGEGGVLPDPVRGYGLVTKATQFEYAPAIEAEPAMREQLSLDARAKAAAFADNMALEGFDDTPLALELVTDDADTIIKGYEEAKGKQEKPENWDDVWHLEVGFAMSQEEIKKLQAKIIADPKADVKDMFSEVIENTNREGLYRLVFGPVGSMQDAVRHCVALKRVGHDCFAKPPREE